MRAAAAIGKAFGTRSPTPSTGRGDLEQVRIGDATRITVERVRALIERSQQKKAA
ncbi:MAG: hypothetical protein ACN6O8_10740 [Achromobacter sp.]|uniref:hypothetical protein n=1 Tax=Achromobacter sp. TaxID=134375 RepID=UPI003CFEF9CE